MTRSSHQVWLPLYPCASISMRTRRIFSPLRPVSLSREIIARKLINSLSRERERERDPRRGNNHRPRRSIRLLISSTDGILHPLPPFR